MRTALACATLLFATAANADTFTVTTTDDTTTCVVGNCSLRGAVVAADALSVPSTINLPAGTYQLTLGAYSDDGDADPTVSDLDVSVDLTINGSGRPTTIVEQKETNGARVFDVASQGKLSLNNLTLRAAIPYSSSSQGGGIRVQYNGVAHIDGVEITGAGDDSASRYWRQGGAVYVSSGSQFTGSNCLIDHNSANQGGGIFSQGATSLDHCAISNNVAYAQDGYFWDGGGIYQDSGGLAGLTITHSTVDFNRVGEPAPFTACEYGRGVGGGILLRDAPINLSNVTIYGNTAAGSGGGIFYQYYSQSGSPPNTLNHVTISGNAADDSQLHCGDGGGLYVNSGLDAYASDDPYTTNWPVALTNSVVAGNIDFLGTGDANYSPDCFAEYSSLTGENPNDHLLSGNGLIQNQTNCELITGSTFVAAAANLAPFDYYGGDPDLLTQPPVWPDTNVIDAVGCSLGDDERGLSRPGGPRCELGAIELNGVHIADATVARPKSGTAPLTFVVTLDSPPPAGAQVSLNWATSDDSAKSPADFAAASGTLVLTAQSGTIVVQVNAGAYVAPSIDMHVTLSAPSIGNAIYRAVGTGTITDIASTTPLISQPGTTSPAGPVSQAAPLDAGSFQGGGCTASGAPAVGIVAALFITLRRRRR